MVLDLYWSIVPLCYLITHCSAQTCPALPGSDFNNINISPRPSANDPLTGGDTLGARCGEVSNTPNMAQCLARSPFPPLIDGDLGPEGTNYTNTMVHAWHRSTGTVTIEYIFDGGNGVEIRHINLYFYSITSMGIGLPSVTVYRGSTVVEYHIFGNDDIIQDDNMRHQILLSLRLRSSSKSYTLQFDFDNTDVEWLVLSETRLCSDPFPAMIPTDPPSLLPVPSPVRMSADNINLSCTVEGEGRFSWQWTDPDGNVNSPSAVILSNVTRTSIATFTNVMIRGNASETNLTFTCTATYNPLVSGVERNNVSQEITVVVQAIETSPTPVTTENTSSSTENTNSSTGNTTMPTTNGSRSVLVIAVAVSLVVILLLVVSVVVIVIVLWRCRHQHTAKEEASHTSSQTHTHPVVSLCEETGQVQYVSEQQDSPSHTYSSIQNPRAWERRGTEQEYSTLYHGENQVQRKKKGAKQRQKEETEMQEYSTVYHGDKPSKTRRGAGKGPENPPVYDQIDQSTTGADALDKVVKTKKIKITSSAAPPSTETETPVDQLYAQVDKKKKNKKAKEPTCSPETAVDQLYAQVDKKKKNKKAKEPTSSPETPVDQLYAQVNKKKQMSKEKEVCPEESGAVYSVVNKPSPPQVPTKSQQLLEEIG